MIRCFLPKMRRLRVVLFEYHAKIGFVKGIVADRSRRSMADATGVLAYDSAGDNTFANGSGNRLACAEIELGDSCSKFHQQRDSWRIFPLFVRHPIIPRIKCTIKSLPWKILQRETRHGPVTKP